MEPYTPMHPVMAMLAAGVPLTLLLDLQRPEGPDSEVILLTEQPAPSVVLDGGRE
jgi:hypothetical protein